MTLRRKFRIMLGVMQSIIFIWLIAFALPIVVDVNAASAVGLGDIGFTETRSIEPNVEMSFYMGVNNIGEQKAHTVTFAKGALTPVASYGNYLRGGETVQQIATIEKATRGGTVVTGINGDFYDTSNHIPNGCMIIDGKLVVSNVSGWPAFGFKPDGSVVFGNPQFNMSMKVDGNNITINHLNRDRKVSTSGIYMYTNAYSSTVSSSAPTPGTEVVLTTDATDLFKINQTITATVEAVYTNTNNTAIGAGKIVIGTPNANAAALSGLTVGKTITITVSEPANIFSQVDQAMGYNVHIVKNGALTDVISNQDVHPRTALGVKANGEVVLFQVDGRQPNWSLGVTYKQIGEHLMSLGCVEVINLDGGGSSSIIAKLPGDTITTHLNSPSDGVERANSNGIVFFSKLAATGTTALLHAYPKKLVVLEGATKQIDLKATDANYYPSTMPSNINYTTSSGIGTISSSGLFTASTGSSTGTINITSGSITETVDVTVIDTIDQMIVDKTQISIAPGATSKPIVSAFSQGMQVDCSNSSFQWTLSSPDLGTITPDGLFTGTSGSATGTITVSYKTFSLEIPVEVGKAPAMINTFEDFTISTSTFIDNGSGTATWIQRIENPQNGGTGSFSVNEDERYVKFGYKSLRADYDFRNATATTAITIGGGASISQYVNINNYPKVSGGASNYPTAIGMWVYGDNGGADVRMQLRDGNGAVQYISYNVVNWTGWKYVEAPIPTGLPTPLYIQYAIRVMSVSGKCKSAGTLFFDNIRVVYGFKNDDITSPVFGDPVPADGSIIDDDHETVKVNVSDPKTGIYTGIRKESIKMWLNGNLIENVILLDKPDGSIDVTFTPNVYTAFKAGPQFVKVRVEDNYGNISFKSWNFTMEGDYAGVTAVAPTKPVVYAGETLTYQIDYITYDSFAKFDTILTYNGDALKVDSIVLADSRLNVERSDSANTLGLVITGMDAFANSAPESKTLVQIVFSPKTGFVSNSDTALIFTKVQVTESGSSTPRNFELPSYEKKVDYKYRVSYATSTVGRPITFTVTDEALNPTAGATLTVSGISGVTISGTTNANGNLTTDAFKNLAVGTTFQVTASFEGLSSEPKTIKIFASLESATPSGVAISPGLDASKSVVITWRTNLTTTESVVKYKKAGDADWITVSTGETSDIVVVNGTVDIQEYLAHKVVLNNLSPNTSYTYVVGDGGDNQSPEKTFKTAKDTTGTKLVFISDPQASNASAYAYTKTLLDTAFTNNADIQAILVGGDIVDDGNFYNQWQALHSTLGERINTNILATASGNHDVIRGYGEPLNWTFPGTNNGVDGTLGLNYFFEIGDIAIAVVDTESPATLQAQGDWLKDKFANTTKTFKFVLMHRSCYPTFYDEPAIRNGWYPIFDDAKVDLVLSGHDHVYNRTAMKQNNKVAVGVGPTYVVGGSAGNKYYAVSNPELKPWLDVIYDDDNNVYSIIETNGQVLTFKAFALVDGIATQVDSFTIDKSIAYIDSVTISGTSKIVAGESKTYTAVVKDNLNQTMSGKTVTWSLVNAVEGVSINPTTGVLTVSGDVSSDATIVVKAECEGIFATFDVTVQTLIKPVDVMAIITDNAKTKFNDIIK